jgi:hypothetical protein
MPLIVNQVMRFVPVPVAEEEEDIPEELILSIRERCIPLW